MIEPKKHFITLRYADDALEKRFIEDYTEKSRRTVAVGLVVGAVVYGLLFGFMDWLQETNALVAIWSIRVGICLAAMAMYLSMRSAIFSRYMQEMMGLLIFVAGAGLLAMILLDTSPDAYLDGPVLVILPAYVLLRLRFIYAACVGLLLLVLYGLVIYYSEGMRASELWASAVFLFAANLIGMAAGYTLESYARKEFWQTLVIDREREANARLLDVKNHFFANISHEIRTPLTLMLGPVEDSLATSEKSNIVVARRVLQSIQRNGHRLMKFISQLLELSRLDAEQTAFVFERRDVLQFLEQEVMSFQPYAETRQIDLQIDVSNVPDRKRHVFGTDYDRLEIVLSNLISNAIKYTQAGGVVCVALSGNAENGYLLIEVRDNGPGIPENELCHIFDRFYRVASPEIRSERGLGLGLSLTQAIVLQLGGKIEAESKVGFGTKFCVSIPDRADAEMAEDQSAVSPQIDETVLTASDTLEAQPEKDIEGDHALVLVIDDHDEVRAYIRECLESQYDVIEAVDAEAGFPIAKQHIPDMIIVDLMMPGMGGHAFVEQVREEMMLSHVPLVMLTASANEKEKLSALEAGVDAFMTKPFNKRTLVLQVQNLITMRNRLKARYSLEIVSEGENESIVSAESAFLKKLRETVKAHMADEYFNGDALAEEMGVSLRQLQRKTKAITEESPNSFIRLIRLQHAKQLVEAQYGTVAEIAYAVGFSNPTYFTKCFRERFGKAPSEWKREQAELE